MQNDSNNAAIDFAQRVNYIYAALVSTLASQEIEPSLGGKLLYAAELGAQGRTLVVAANIAGAASLAATADQAAGKQATRDGVVDFLVASLDEALRILKNQVRKRETVAVCVAAAPEAVEREMLERGVLPDLLPSAPTRVSYEAAFMKQGARRLEAGASSENTVLVVWKVSAAPAQWLPKVDAMALDCLYPQDWRARRWLRFAPRYLGRLAQGVRVAGFTPEARLAFISRVEEGMRSGEIGVEVTIESANQTH